MWSVFGCVVMGGEFKKISFFFILIGNLRWLMRKVNDREDG